jgi:hypothetical protein
MKKLLLTCVLAGLTLPVLANSGDVDKAELKMTADQINEHLIGVTVPVPKSLNIDPVASQSELGELTSEILSHLLISVESIDYKDEKNAFVKANIGTSKCEMHYENTPFKAKLSSGKFTDWKLTKMDCQK